MKSNLIKFILMMILSMLVLTGCGQPGDIVLAESDSGSQVTLNPGQTLVIQLEGNPSTGFTWEVAEVDASVLGQVGDIEFEADSELLGAGGIQRLRFEPSGSGETVLELVYHRPWETEDPAQTFSVQVIVP